MASVSIGLQLTLEKANEFYDDYHVKPPADREGLSIPR